MRKLKSLFLAYSALLISIALISCQKDEKLSDQQKLKASVGNINDLSGKPNVIVHAGSSIQSAINAAGSGSIIAIQPGIYNEALVVNKKGIFIIGIGNGVIIQNPADEENGITVMDNANDFVLKNVTIKNFKENGVFLSHVKNFLISGVTTINNGEYGIFPVFCENGIIDHCSATGHTDTGIYVGQSSNVLVLINKAFGNVNGIEIENCHNIAVSKNESYNNTCGVLAVLLPGLTVKSSSDVLVNDNYVHDNNLPNFAPAGNGFEVSVPVGCGILVVGVDNATIKNNKITNNNLTGVAVVSTLVLGGLSGLPPEAFADIEPNADGARIIKNELSGNGTAPPPGLPLPGVDLLWDGTGINNCWSYNIFTSSYPSPLPSCTP